MQQEQPEPAQAIQLVPMGRKLVRSAAGQYAIQIGDTDTELLETGTMRVPSIFGKNEALVSEEALYTIAPDPSLEVVSRNCTIDPLLPYRLFTLAAMWPSADEIAFTISDMDGFVAVRGGLIKGEIIAHWIHGTSLMGVVSGLEDNSDQAEQCPVDYARKILPSDLMYACTIINSYLAIGSTQFVLRRDWDFPDIKSGDHRGQFVVAHDDMQFPGIFFGTRFPIGGKV